MCFHTGCSSNYTHFPIGLLDVDRFLSKISTLSYRCGTVLDFHQIPKMSCSVLARKKREEKWLLLMSKKQKSRGKIDKFRYDLTYDLHDLIDDLTEEVLSVIAMIGHHLEVCDQVLSGVTFSKAWFLERTVSVFAIKGFDERFVDL